MFPCDSSNLYKCVFNCSWCNPMSLKLGTFPEFEGLQTMILLTDTRKGKFTVIESDNMW